MFLEYHWQYHFCKCFLISLTFVLCFTYQNALDIVFALFFTVDPASSFGLGLSRGQFCIVNNSVSLKSMFRSWMFIFVYFALLFFPHGPFRIYITNPSLGTQRSARKAPAKIICPPPDIILRLQGGPIIMFSVMRLEARNWWPLSHLRALGLGEPCF